MCIMGCYIFCCSAYHYTVVALNVVKNITTGRKQEIHVQGV